MKKKNKPIYQSPASVDLNQDYWDDFYKRYKSSGLGTTCDNYTQVISEESRVNHPNYYKLPNGIECVDVIQYFDWNTGSAIKYLWRHGGKKEAALDDKTKAIEDLQKAIKCIEFRIKMLENE